MWDLGIERAMKKFLEDPEIRQCIKEKLHRTVNDPSSFYGSPAFKDLNDDCAGALMMANVLTMLISIGGDGVQLLNWGTRTATVISMKCEDLPMHLVQTGRAVTPIIIIEGPTEPATLDHILRGTADFLGAHAPSHTPNGERLLFSNCPGRTGGIKVKGLVHAVIDGVPVVWSTRHPLHAAADEAVAAVEEAKVRHGATLQDKEDHPRSAAKAAAEALAKTQLSAAEDAMKLAAEAAQGVPPIQLEHWFPVLIGLHGDTPFAAKMRRSVGAAARTGCPRCMLMASKKKPNEDGSPGDIKLKATAYGAASCKAQRHHPRMLPTGCTLEKHDNFQYSSDDGTFDKEAAALLFIDDELDDILSDTALLATEAEREKYMQGLNEGLAGLGPNATVQARAQGMYY